MLYKRQLIEDKRNPQKMVNVRDDILVKGINHRKLILVIKTARTSINMRRVKVNRFKGS